MNEENTNKKKAEKSDIAKKNKEENTTNKEKEKELTPEEKIIDLEDKLSRAYAEMENQEEGMKKKKMMHLNTVVLVLLGKLLIC